MEAAEASLTAELRTLQKALPRRRKALVRQFEELEKKNKEELKKFKNQLRKAQRERKLRDVGGDFWVKEVMMRRLQEVVNAWMKLEELRGLVAALKVEAGDCICKAVRASTGVLTKMNQVENGRIPALPGTGNGRKEEKGKFEFQSFLETELGNRNFSDLFFLSYLDSFLVSNSISDVDHILPFPATSTVFQILGEVKFHSNNVLAIFIPSQHRVSLAPLSLLSFSVALLPTLPTEPVPDLQVPPPLVHPGEIVDIVSLDEEVVLESLPQSPGKEVRFEIFSACSDCPVSPDGHSLEDAFDFFRPAEEDEDDARSVPATEIFLPYYCD
jgi:hypothetical protein